MACSGAAEEGSAAQFGEVALFTSLPLVWPEQTAIRDHLADHRGRHWVVDELERHGPLQPIDALVDGEGKSRLPDGLLVMAQPRALTPQENVALDRWVRSGGRLLLFADPMLTAESAFPLGDPRRPQDIVMISPILTHWGLTLQFDDAQPVGERSAEFSGTEFPINLPGSLNAVNRETKCTVAAKGLIADCVVGAGRVLVYADAALLEDAVDNEDAHRRSQGLAVLVKSVSQSG